ncbi:MAG: hypothetical protein CMF61_05230 [Magnetococcales bacterium]|nr:hypothetical protein [Magnetococcales bacterium]
MIKKIFLGAAFAIWGNVAMAVEVNDPLESVNRPIASFNDTVDRYVLKPIAQGYDSVTPEFVQDGVSNFFDNLTYPIVVTNQFLQGKVKLGFQDTTRFLINSTFGIAGLFDVADKFGLKEHNEDFGQTLGVWGVTSGPYVVLPFFGPSSVRDAVARGGDYYIDPSNYEYFDDRRATKNRMTALSVISTRAELLKAERLISGDKYAFMRDAYLQKREDMVRDGKSETIDDPFLDD